MLIKNFLFHRVSEENDKLWQPMRPALFEAIITNLLKTHNVISLEEFLTNSPGSRSSKAFATILFDDGFKDNIDYAAPILEKYNCPASFYVVTDCIDKNIPTWTYLLGNALQKTTITELSLSYDYVPQELKLIPRPTDKLSNQLITKVKPWMKSLSNKRRQEILNAILTQCKDVDTPHNKMMNWNDIRELKQHGFIIGSHSHTHPMLGRLEEETEINEELVISSSSILRETGVVPQTISYPIGSFDERVIKLVQKNGYKWGLAVEQRFYIPGKDSLFAIPRIELYQEPWWRVKLRMNGIYGSLKRLLKNKNEV
jgi:peptidoglycan/xylan/chitin deacetylase (PgdA/CDA1 family)